jgi:hypothetical protein
LQQVRTEGGLLSAAGCRRIQGSEGVGRQPARTWQPAGHGAVPAGCRDTGFVPSTAPLLLETVPGVGQGQYRRCHLSRSPLTLILCHPPPAACRAVLCCGVSPPSGEKRQEITAQRGQQAVLLSDHDRDRLEDMLRGLTAERAAIAEVGWSAVFRGWGSRVQGFACQVVGSV